MKFISGGVFGVIIITFVQFFLNQSIWDIFFCLLKNPLCSVIRLMHIQRDLGSKWVGVPLKRNEMIIPYYFYSIWDFLRDKLLNRFLRTRELEMLLRGIKCLRKLCSTYRHFIEWGMSRKFHFNWNTHPWAHDDNFSFLLTKE